ncbi:MAG: ligand-binding sensor domain-containing protein [Patiriisocius sp.]|jgi:ligand-binding sensor domain-containing protein
MNLYANNFCFFSFLRVLITLNDPILYPSIMKNGLFLFFLSISFGAIGQNTLGQWNDYLSYRSVTDVVEAGDVIFAACQNSIFSYDRSDNSLSRYSSVNGLSDKNITDISWNENNSILLIGYENGNIDFLGAKGVINFSDIKRSTITSNKSINDFYNDGDNVWISTGFGIVKIDLPNEEVIETYVIGDGGLEINISNVVHTNDLVFAATNEGLFQANLNSSLQDFNNWSLVNTLPVANYDQVFVLGNTPGAFMNNPQDKRVFRLLDGLWTEVLTDTNLNKVMESNGKLLLLRDDELRVRDQDFTVVYSLDDYNFTDKEDIFTAVLDSEDKLWIGDINWGLIEDLGSSNVNSYMPEGPSTNSSWEVSSVGNQTWVAHGGVKVTFNASGSEDFFSGLNSGTWETYKGNEFLLENGVRDLVDLAINPNNPQQVFFGSWNGGLIEKMSNGDVEIYHEGKGNSVIQEGSQVNNYRIGGLTYDNDGNLWQANSTGEFSGEDQGLNENQIIVRQPDATEIVLSCLELDNSIKMSSLIHTSNGQIWGVNAASSDGRLFVLDYNGTVGNANDDQCMKINTNADSGGLPTNLVICVAEDLDGEIWIGTSEGPAVIYSPEFLFESNPPEAQQIKIEQDGNVEIVLSTTSITTIAIDGANRKWLGTTSSGAFLLSEDGTEQILHFTQENSPLLENSIRDISINRETGEVFFATDEGLLSYIGDATSGSRDNECFKVFPNPVRPDYFGPIAIDGLARDSNVKITDIAGNLVYETVSNGGRAIWDATNFSGDRVQSGIYLALITSLIDDRETSCISKIMVIN